MVPLAGEALFAGEAAATAAGVLAATVGSTLGVVLYLVVAFLVLRLSIRWAREALAESGPVAAPSRGSSPKTAARG
jgi:hypothetical protein